MFPSSPAPALRRLQTSGTTAGSRPKPPCPNASRLRRRPVAWPSDRRTSSSYTMNSSFDIRAVDGIKVPRHYGEHFRSFDGRQLQFIVESHGGASWFAEYNVLTGLSSRSFGRFAYFLTRVAAGHIDRGMPRALQNCGHTWPLVPLGRRVHECAPVLQTTGLQNFLDSKALGTSNLARCVLIPRLIIYIIYVSKCQKKKKKKKNQIAALPLSLPRSLISTFFHNNTLPARLISNIWNYADG